jgi:hypothetical protein
MNPRKVFYYGFMLAVVTGVGMWPVENKSSLPFTAVAHADTPTPFVVTIEKFTIAVTDAPYTSGTYDLTKGQVPANTLLLMNVKREGTDYTAAASAFKINFDDAVPNRVVVHRTKGDAPFYATVSAIEFDPNQVNVYKQHWALSTSATAVSQDLRNANRQVYAKPDKAHSIAFASYTATGDVADPSTYYVTTLQSDVGHVEFHRFSTGGGKVAIDGQYTTIEARGDQFRTVRQSAAIMLWNKTTGVSGPFDTQPSVQRDRTAIFTTIRTLDPAMNLGPLGYTAVLTGTDPNPTTLTYQRGTKSSSMYVRPVFVTQMIEFLQGDSVTTQLVNLMSGDSSVALDETGIDADHAIAGLTSGGSTINAILDTPGTPDINIGYMDVYFSGSNLVLEHNAIPNDGSMQTYAQIINLRTQY